MCCACQVDEASLAQVVADVRSLVALALPALGHPPAAAGAAELMEVGRVACKGGGAECMTV